MAPSIDQVQHLIQNYGTHPQGVIMQHPGELLELVMWLIAHECKTVLEIGAYQGGFHGLLEDCGIQCWSIDLVEPKLLERDFFIGDSAHDAAVAWASRHAPYDAVFIDGDHRYPFVIQDYKNYHGMARKAVIFHDISGREFCEGVKMFWEQMKPRNQEVIQRPDGQGVGILRKEEPCPKP